MGRKIVRCGMVGLIVLIFGFCQMAFAETYEGTMKLDGNWYDYDTNGGTDYKGKVNEKLTIYLTSDVQGILAVHGISVDEEKSLISRNLDVRTFFPSRRRRGFYVDANGTEHYIHVAGELKINESTQKLTVEKGKFIGSSIDSVVNGSCNVEAQVRAQVPIVE